MSYLAPKRPARRTVRPLDSQRTVCVVDPQHDDYQAWRATAEAHGLHLKFMATADAALRIARTERVDLWVINTALPGLAGTELCSMLRAQGKPGAIYLVANEYSPITEHTAWRARATAFLCKPAHHGALAGWLERSRGKPPNRSKPIAHSV